MARTEQGFTLVELLIALLVFSFVAAAGAYALRLGVDARDQLSVADARVAELQTARAVIRDDLFQLAPRVVRDEFGEPFGPPFQGGAELTVKRTAEGERLLAAFVRRGWINPGAEAPRSSLQFVEYLDIGGALVRRARPFLDDARDQPTIDRVLIADAANLDIAFLAGDLRGELDWRTGWPEPRGGDGPPLAVSITYRSARYGALTQMFWIGRSAAAGAGAS